jgi:hypothetical protein
VRPHDEIDVVDDVRVARSANPDDAAVLDADVGLPHSEERIDHDDVADEQVELAVRHHSAGGEHRLAEVLPAAAEDLVSVRGVVTVDFHGQRGVGQPDPVAGGRPVERRVEPAVDVAHAGPPGICSVAVRPVPASATSRTDRRSPAAKLTEVPAGTSKRMPAAASRGNCSARLTCAKG